MKKIVLFLILIPTLIFCLDVSGNQNGIWSINNSPINIVGDITVPNNSTLTIEPGVEIIAEEGFKLTVEGNIIAIGTINDSIKFKSLTNWSGIRLENTTMLSKFEYCRVSNINGQNNNPINSINSPVEIKKCLIDENEEGLNFFALAETNPATVIVDDVIVKNCEKSGINIIENRNVLISNSEIFHCGYGTQFRAAIQISGQTTNIQNNPKIENCRIHDNYKQGITSVTMFNDVVVFPEITNCIIENNFTGIYFYNSIGKIDNCIVRNNFVEENSNSGAGMMLYGDNANAVITNSEFCGNYTGFYIINGATVNLGNVNNYNSSDDGLNYIHDNIDSEGNNNSLFTNSSGTIYAQNCYWNSTDENEISETITDVNDNSGTATVNFLPIAEGNFYITLNGTVNLNEYDGELKIFITNENFKQINSEIYQSAQNEINFSFQVLANNNYYIGAELTSSSNDENKKYGAYPELNNYTLIQGAGENIDNINFQITNQNFNSYIYFSNHENINGKNIYNLNFRNFLYPKYKTFRIYKENNDYLFYSIIKYDGIGEIKQEYLMENDNYYLYSSSLEESFLSVDLVDNQLTQLVAVNYKEICDEIDSSGNPINYSTIKYNTEEGNLVKIMAFKPGIGIKSIYNKNNDTFNELISTNQQNIEEIIEFNDNNEWIMTNENPLKRPFYLSIEPTNKNYILTWDIPLFLISENWNQVKVYYGDNVQSFTIPENPTLEIDAINGNYQISYISENGEESIKSNIVISNFSNNDTIVNDIKLQSTIYPNPFFSHKNNRKNLNISFNKTLKGETSIYIYNILGKELKSIKLKNKNIDDINIPIEQNISSGIYFYKVENKYHKTNGRFTILK